MAVAYVLSESDLAVLRRLLDEDRRRPKNPVHIPDVEPVVPQAPEVYLARTPAGGIPALAEAAGTATTDEPGSAVCACYRVVRDSSPAGTAPPLYQLYPVPVDRLVFNLSTTAAPGDIWVLVVRDKWGSWFALGSGGGGTETGDGDGGGAWDGSWGGGSGSSTPLTSGETVLAGTYSVTGSWATVSYDPPGTGSGAENLEVTLPGAGTYRVTASLVGYLQTNDGPGWLLGRLYNSTDAAAVSTSEASVVNIQDATVKGILFVAEVTWSVLVTVTAAKTIAVQAKAETGTMLALTLAAVHSDIYGRSRINYTQVA